MGVVGDVLELNGMCTKLPIGGGGCVAGGGVGAVEPQSGWVSECGGGGQED